MTTHLRALLDQLDQAHAMAGPFWERCGCLAGLGEIPSVSDCHQAGLCRMRQADRERNADVRRLVAAVRAALELAGELESFTVNRNPAPGSYDAGVVAAFVNAAARIRAVLAPLTAEPQP